MATPTDPPPILWDVLEEHLDEAGWFWELRQDALRALDHTLEDVERGDEARLLAHLDGLVVGGAEAAEELLLPALESDRPRVAAAAAWALLAAPERDHAGAVLEALRSGDAPRRAALAGALALSPRPGLDALLLQALPAAALEAQPALLEALALRGADAGAALLALKPQRDEALFAAAVRAARSAGAAAVNALLPAALQEASAAVREAALETGLALGRREALRAARRLLEQGVASRAALFAAAASGGPADLELLARCAAAPALRAEALWALGFSGRRAAAEAALRALEEGADRVAAEAFLMVTGCELGPDAVTELGEDEAEEEAPPPDLDGDADADAAADDGAAPAEEPGDRPDPSSLPGPAWPRADVEVHALVRWWGDHQDAFDPGRRHWYGAPFTAEALLAALAQAPCRLRPALALELSARSRGALRVDPFALAAAQHAQLARARALPPAAAQKPYDELFG